MRVEGQKLGYCLPCQNGKTRISKMPREVNQFDISLSVGYMYVFILSTGYIIYQVFIKEFGIT